MNDEQKTDVKKSFDYVVDGIRRICTYAVYDSGGHWYCCIGKSCMPGDCYRQPFSNSTQMLPPQ